MQKSNTDSADGQQCKHGTPESKASPFVQIRQCVRPGIDTGDPLHGGGEPSRLRPFTQSFPASSNLFFQLSTSSGNRSVIPVQQLIARPNLFRRGSSRVLDFTSDANRF